MGECVCAWGKVDEKSPLSPLILHQRTPQDMTFGGGREGHILTSLSLPTSLQTLAGHSPHPNNQLKKPQKANPAQTDQSCLDSEPRSCFLAFLPRPLLWAPSCHSHHSPFLQRPPFWDKNYPHFVSNRLYFFVKRDQKRARKKRKKNPHPK